MEEHDKVTEKSFLSVSGTREFSLDDLSINQNVSVDGGSNVIAKASNNLDVPVDVLQLADVKFAYEQNVLPARRDGDLVTAYYSDEGSRRIAENYFKSKHKNLDFNFVLRDRAYIREQIEFNYSRQNVLIDTERIEQRYQSITNEIKKDDTVKSDIDLIFSTDTQFDDSDSAARKLIKSVILEIVAMGGNNADFDIAVKNGNHYLVCRARINGRMRTIREIEMSLDYCNRIARIWKLMCGLEPSNVRDGKTGIVRPKLDIGGREPQFQLRVNFIPMGENRGESICIRIQKKDDFNFTLENLGLFASQLELIRKRIINKPRGGVLSCGSVGQGKSTLQFCIVQEIFKLFSGEKKIVTVEDIIEFIMNGVLQIETMNKSAEEGKVGEPRDFSYYTKYLLRHQPDVVVLGEIRQNETARMFLEFPENGHLTLGTIHTEDAVGSIERLINLHVDHYKIAQNLRAAIGQRLLERTCPYCVKVEDPSYKEIAHLEKYVEATGWQRDLRWLKASGINERGETCKHCNGSGYKGQIGIFEVFLISTAIRRLINNRRPPLEIREAALCEGLRTLWSCGLVRVLQGLTTIEQLLYWIGEPDDPAAEGLSIAGGDYNISLDDEQSTIN